MREFWIKGMIASLGLIKGCSAFAHLSDNLYYHFIVQAETAQEVTIADIEAALADQKKKCPHLHEDALRVWKNFKSAKTDPNYTYRFWARDIVLWLQKNRGLSFNTEEKVAKVFMILFEKEIISKDAERLLTNDVWSFLIYREGMPERERRLPLYDRSQKDKDEHEV